MGMSDTTDTRPPRLAEVHVHELVQGSGVRLDVALAAAEARS